MEYPSLKHYCHLYSGGKLQLQVSGSNGVWLKWITAYQMRCVCVLGGVKQLYNASQYAVNLKNGECGEMFIMFIIFFTPIIYFSHQFHCATYLVLKQLSFQHHTQRQKVFAIITKFSLRMRIHWCPLLSQFLEVHREFLLLFSSALLFLIYCNCAYTPFHTAHNKTEYK